MVSCDVLLCIYSRDQMIYKKLPSCCRIIPLGYNTVRGSVCPVCVWVGLDLREEAVHYSTFKFSECLFALG